MTGLIVHEWLSKSGGSENVVAAMREAIPDTDLFCLWNDDAERFDGNVKESWLARTPLRGRKALALPFMPAVWRNLSNDNDYDWILASSHLFAHQARFRSAPDVPKFVYVHTPARYVWSPELDERGAHPLARIAAPALRAIDRRFAQDESKIAANSEYVRQRIEKTWRRESAVIYPPIDVARIQAEKDWTTQLTTGEQILVDSLPQTFVLGASRFVPYKKLEAVISVGEANDLPVVLAGRGPEEARLRELAATSKVPVVFVNRPSDALLYVLYALALVYVFPAIEDFGIMPVEAMAAGARVIVNSVGGAKESVVHGITGHHAELFDGHDAVAAVEAVAQMSPNESVMRAREFDSAIFTRKIEEWLFPAIDTV